MGRLTNLKPQLTSLRPSVAFMPEGEQQRNRHRDTQPWRQWYKTSRWQKLRWSILVRDSFTCGLCKRCEGRTSLLVADHRTPHHGNEAMFWDEKNIWTICKPCHDGEKQRQERRR